MSWIDDNKGQGPWELQKQPDKLGYVNNPFWTKTATGKHDPCGYWLTGDNFKVTTYTNYIQGTGWIFKAPTITNVFGNALATHDSQIYGFSILPDTLAKWNNINAWENIGSYSPVDQNQSPDIISFGESLYVLYSYIYKNEIFRIVNNSFVLFNSGFGIMLRRLIGYHDVLYATDTHKSQLFRVLDGACVAYTDNWTDGLLANIVYNDLLFCATFGGSAHDLYSWDGNDGSNFILRATLNFGTGGVIQLIEYNEELYIFGKYSLGYKMHKWNGVDAVEFVCNCPTHFPLTDNFAVVYGNRLHYIDENGILYIFDDTTKEFTALTAEITSSGQFTRLIIHNNLIYADLAGSLYEYNGYINEVTRKEYINNILSVDNAVWPFEKSVQKPNYNEGNLISTYANPVWNNEHLGTAITKQHKPCGYWTKNYIPPKAPLPPPTYNWITAIFHNPPQMVAKINYSSGEIGDNGIFDITPPVISAIGYNPVVYKDYLYAAVKDGDDQLVLVKFNLVTMTVEDTLIIIPPNSFNFPTCHCLRENILYIGVQSTYPGISDRERVYEIDLDSFTTLRSVGLYYGYGSVHTIIATGSMLYVFVGYGVFPVYLSNFLKGTYGMIEYDTFNNSVVCNKVGTECIVTNNSYTVYRVSLTDPPVILETKAVLFLTRSHSVMLDANNYAYFGDKKQAKIHRINMSIFDDFVDFDYSSFGMDAPFNSLQYAEGKGFFVSNNTWYEDSYRKIVKMDLATMEVDSIISLPIDPYVDTIHSIVIS
ncbi:MAG: hypothetical protein ACTSQA_00440 [Candidatus Heimdallarchaeaceae archaeon]